MIFHLVAAPPALVHRPLGRARGWPIRLVRGRDHEQDAGRPRLHARVELGEWVLACCLLLTCLITLCAVSSHPTLRKSSSERKRETRKKHTIKVRVPLSHIADEPVSPSGSEPNKLVRLSAPICTSDIRAASSITFWAITMVWRLEKEGAFRRKADAHVKLCSVRGKDSNTIARIDPRYVSRRA